MPGIPSRLRRTLRRDAAAKVASGEAFVGSDVWSEEVAATRRFSRETARGERHGITPRNEKAERLPGISWSITRHR